MRGTSLHATGKSPRGVFAVAEKGPPTRGIRHMLRPWGCSQSPRTGKHMHVGMPKHPLLCTHPDTGQNKKEFWHPLSAGQSCVADAFDAQQRAQAEHHAHVVVHTEVFVDHPQRLSSLQLSVVVLLLLF